MNSNKQEPQPDPYAHTHARRKLLRGSFAAPVVLTVYSGSAQAAISAEACLVHANAAPITSGLGVTSADDVLFRYQLYGLVDNSNSSNILSYWISGAELASFVRGGQVPFLTVTQFQQFDISANALITGTITSATPSQVGYTFAKVDRYVVLRISSTGQVVGAGGTGGGAAVGDSCWNSFAIATAPIS